MLSWNLSWLFAMSYVFAQDPVANLPQGRIVGIKVYNEGSVDPVEIFFGIPYATPPVGRFRFSAPERHPGWRRTFYAHRIPPRCPQLGNNSDNYSEDCLFLNIWTSRRGDGKLQPVIVILYSESWSRGGVSLPCQDLASEGVVVVTVAYRLHFLAFFTLRSVAARGNLALLDQYLALLWVRENIAAFGGDATAITLLGHSAGADSVLHHIISPRSVGLFHKAIAMSPREIWKAIDPDIAVDAAEIERKSRTVAKLIGCSSNSDREILQCMRSRSLSDIISLISNTTKDNDFQPIPDNFLPEPEQYLPMSLSAALAASKSLNLELDFLMGTTNLEALYYSGDIDYETLTVAGKPEFEEYVNNKAIPQLLRLLALDKEEILPALTQTIRWEFWGPNTRNMDIANLDTLETLSRMETSAKWGAGSALLAARLARLVTKLYVYRYSRPTNIDLYGRHLNFSGAVHGSDLIALLGDTLMLQVARRPATNSEKKISAFFKKYIVNFVKYGSPGPQEKWPRYMVGDANIQDICDENIDVCKVNSINKEVAFWLQYLPQISKTFSFSQYAEHIAADKGEERLRGGVLAMCSVCVILLLLLFASAILLHRRRVYRPTIVDGDLPT